MVQFRDTHDRDKTIPLLLKFVKAAAKFRFPPVVSVLDLKPVRFRGCSESRETRRAVIYAVRIERHD